MKKVLLKNRRIIINPTILELHLNLTLIRQLILMLYNFDSIITNYFTIILKIEAELHPCCSNFQAF